MSFKYKEPWVADDANKPAIANLTRILLYRKYTLNIDAYVQAVKGIHGLNHLNMNLFAIAYTVVQLNRVVKERSGGLGMGVEVPVSDANQMITVIFGTQIERDKNIRENLLETVPRKTLARMKDEDRKRSLSRLETNLLRYIWFIVDAERKMVEFDETGRGIERNIDEDLDEEPEEEEADIDELDIEDQKELEELEEYD